jgi:hypothetical protein
VIDAATAAGWAVNLAVAEAIVRRPQRVQARRAPDLARTTPRQSLSQEEPDDHR